MMELTGWSNALFFLPYGEHLRRLRKLVHGTFGTKSRIDMFDPVFTLANSRFLVSLLDDPHGFMDHISL